MNSPNDLWVAILALMEKDMTPTTIKTWFDDVQAVDFQDDTFTLFCPTEFKRNIIISRYRSCIETALQELFSSPCKVIILDEQEMEQYKIKDKSEKKENTFPGTEEFTFERFVVGKPNEFAYSAAQAISDKPGLTYNPLLIYGNSGLGKTHLLHAIAHKIRTNNKNANIIYMKGDNFTNELIQAIRDHTTKEFQDKYRAADVFLMDDVQFIAGKDSTMEEMFNTFNSLYDNKKQLVFTSDRPPKDIRKLEDRLKTRFEWGLMADIEPPDLETCIAILKNKSLRLGVEIPDPVIQYIADNLVTDKSRTNVRLIEGTVKKIMALRDLSGKNVDIDTVIRAVRDVLKDTSDIIPTADIIIKEVCDYYNVEENSVRGSDRKKNIVMVRHIAIYMIRNITNLPYKEIGREFGNRDHTTIMHSTTTIESLMKTDMSINEVIKDIHLNINSRY